MEFGLGSAHVTQRHCYVYFPDFICTNCFLSYASTQIRGTLIIA